MPTAGGGAQVAVGVLEGCGATVVCATDVYGHGGEGVAAAGVGAGLEPRRSTRRPLGSDPSDGEGVLMAAAADP